ncbi:MAG: HEAT repeat domain-containing protein [Phormidium sp. PBR-2020]|nr:MAG: HEAT repeat domain-containing protein [Phormidium sp. PBR-2020]
MTTSTPTSADALIAALHEPGRENLLDLVRNPLRLTLLCMTWDGSSLPETQAELYARYLKEVYQWNRNLQEWRDHAQRCGTNITKLKQELNRQLGELAKVALNLPEERFRLSQALVEEYLGEELDETSLGYLALRLGWLNRVGRDKRGNSIFAFYHATFQEYFAALAVEDWDYFLPRNHVDCPVEGKQYRIFEPQWKQVILLWLGRGDIGDEEKEGFIEALVEFEGGVRDFCRVRDFYGYQAYFLAAAAINQFKSCSLAAKILRQVVQWGFGYFNTEKQQWQIFLDPIEEAARKVIPETIRPLAISALIEFIENCLHKWTRSQAAESLEKIGQGHPDAIAGLLEIIRTTEDEYTRSQAAESLGKIDPGNADAIAELLKFIRTTENKDIRRQAAKSLEEIGQGHPDAIAGLLEIIRTTEDEYTRRQAAKSLEEIGQGHPDAIAGLIEIIRTTENKDIRRQAVKSLEKIGQGHPDAIAGLVEIIRTTEDENTRRQVAHTLFTLRERIRQINFFNALPMSIGHFPHIRDKKYEDIHRWVAYSLEKIGQGNADAITGLVEIIRTTEDEKVRKFAAESLWKIGPGNPETIAVLLQIIRTTENEDTRRGAAESLEKIGQGNADAITGLVEIIRTTEDEKVRKFAAESLWKIDPGNPDVITGLVEIIRTTEDEKVRKFAAESLWKIDPGNPDVIAGLVEVIRTTENKHIRRQAAESLEKILTTSQQYAGVVSALKDCLSDEVRQNNFYRFEECYEVIWNCAENLPYPEFYQAWHHPSTTPHPEVEDTNPVASTPFTQHCNLALLPQSINQAIQSSSRPPNSQVICIDGSRFSDPSNPALQIYTALKKAGCPASPDGKPRTIGELQAYCEDDLSEQKIALIFYEAPTDPPPQGFDRAVLNQLARFSHPPIAVVVPQPLPDCRLLQFLESDPDLIANILQWLHNLER